MGDISSLPADVIHNILVRLPINLLVKLKYVCKRWNRLLSHPCYGPRGDRKILLPFAPVDVLEENDMTRSMVTLNSSHFENPESKVVIFAGSCNGIVLLVIQDYYRWLPGHTHMVLYNPLTGANKPVPDDSHSKCNKSSNHVYGFGYGSTPDDLKIVRFRGCEYSSTNDDRHTCDVFSPKTNSWIKLKNFVQNADWLDDVGTFANGSLHWIANSKNHYQECDKILALDVKNMVLSDIHLPFHRLLSCYCPSVLGTLHGSLCVVAKKWTSVRNQFKVWVMTGEGVEKSWLEASSFALKLKSIFAYHYPITILDDDGMVLLFLLSFPNLVIYDATKRSP